MKTIKIGKRYEIYDDTIETNDTLPAQSYIIRFDKMSGFYLEESSDIEIKEDKIYGVHLEKVHKVLNTFSKLNKNLGVILSGDKGIGKTLFAKILAKEAIGRELPLIIVDKYVPGIASYIESIGQPVMVLFDEFDKTFYNNADEEDPQETLLTLFDGLSSGKKLFVITCNEIRYLSEYFINRPGRFHYHFRFQYPTTDEIQKYLEDKLDKNYYGEIEKVIMFAARIDINYDCLRAIAFELNSGLSFEDAIKDLNIVNIEEYYYDLTLHFDDGSVLVSKERSINLFSIDSHSCYFRDSNGEGILALSFDPADCEYDAQRKINIVRPENFKISYENPSELSKEEVIKRYKSLRPEYLEVTRSKEVDVHYML